MSFSDSPALVTGGAGFIGSHIVDQLLEFGVEVNVIDDLSNGSLSNLEKVNHSSKLNFNQTNLNDMLKEKLGDVTTVFHVAAYPEVRTGFSHPEKSFYHNIETTFNFLENIRKSKVNRFVFTSSSTIYGEPNVIPTPEDYGPLLPISPYGASKLACEAMISSYCHTYGIESIIFRLANIIGKRSNHGVIYDFIAKLQKNPKKLEILGDGNQTKSYLHIHDCIDCFFHCLSKTNNLVEIFNVGNEDSTNVMKIAEIVSNSMNLHDVEIKTSEKTKDRGGWIGDVKQMQLNIEKLKKIGWEPKLNSNKAVQTATEELLG